MNHTHADHGEHLALHVAFKITKLALKAASVAAAFCIMKEIHKVHKAIEKHGKNSVTKQFFANSESESEFAKNCSILQYFNYFYIPKTSTGASPERLSL